MRYKLITVLILLFFLSSFSFSHSGRTDSNGGHYNRKTGVYHYHNSGTKTSSSYNRNYSTGCYSNLEAKN